MKKNIVCLIISMFAITAKAAENKEISSIKSFEAYLHAETRGDARPLEKRMKDLKIKMDFKDVKLTLLDPKFISSSGSDTGKSIKLLQLKKNQSNIGLRATLIAHKMMDTSMQGLLLATFSSDDFVRDIEQQLKNENVYFKLSGVFWLNQTHSDFYFSVPSKQIIADFALQHLKQVSPENSNQSNRWIRYAIPFGLLAILSVWYFKYKH